MKLLAGRAAIDFSNMARARPAIEAMQVERIFMPVCRDKWVSPEWGSGGSSGSRGTPPLMVMALKKMSMRWPYPCHVLPGTEYIVNTL